MDHAASAPLETKVFSAMKKFMTGNYSNAGALHKGGLVARKAIEEARGKVARILGAQKEEIIFTGSATESNNLAIFGIVASAFKIFSSCALPGVPGGTLGDKKFQKPPHIITTNIEHPSVLIPAKKWEQLL